MNILLDFLISKSGFALLTIAILVWLACGPFFGWSEVWYRAVDAPIFISTLFLTLLIQYKQNIQIKWMEERLAEIDEQLTGKKKEPIR